MTSYVVALGASPEISTHTPAWGVTYSVYFLPAYTMISTHTPAWGVTNNTCKNAAVSGISTHTPAWGVTDSADAVPGNQKFQLTRPRGA